MSTGTDPEVPQVVTSQPFDEPIRGLARDAIAKSFLVDDRPTVYVHCPEWGGHVKLIAMTGDQAERFAKSREKEKDSGTGMYAIISACAIDENGARLFPDPDVLRGRSLSVLNRLQNAALKLNGFREEAVNEAKKG